jgi:hypothetical protein
MSLCHFTSRARSPRSHITRYGLSCAALCGLLIASVGCGSKSGPERVPVFPVQGAVTFKGQPMPGAMLVLHPKTAADDVPAPRAQVDKDGNVKVSTYDGGDGAPAGEYVVTVQWYKLIKNGNDVTAGPNVVPLKYSQATSSDLVVQVADGGANTFDFKL